MMKWIYCMMLCLLPLMAQATPDQAWSEAVSLAQQGNDKQAIAMLRGAQLQYSRATLWTQRFSFASRLLKLRQQAKYHNTYVSITLLGQNNHEILLANWLKQHPVPQTSGSTMSGLFAALIPGAGHAWQGRWGDAGVAAMLVWPLLILTFWAARRDMGPVTVFFALITAWLWSGTVFSAVSLAERGDFELYEAWWQEMWMASGLPSRVW
ncbi:MAG: hypothetical protein Q9M19_07635 [Mariprofundaceae bacterium]|nr:hypothetical protein [Mariprofundaceae bacterium]